MTKLTKRILFYSAVAIFLILSYVIILYAQGYKYSFSENQFFKTGAIYLKINIGADVYLDDRLLGDTSFFNNSYRVEGILPGQYTVRVQKDNYSTWQKLITVEEGLVSEFSKVLLLPFSDRGENSRPKELKELDKEIALIFPAPTPTSLLGSTKNAVTPLPAPATEPFVIKKGELFITAEKPEKIAENVKNFILSKDKNKLVWWTANEIWVMWLNDTDYQPYHKTGDKEFVTRFSTQIKKVAWFKDEDHLIIEFNSARSVNSGQVDSGQASYKILEIDTRGGINIIDLFTNKPD